MDGHCRITWQKNPGGHKLCSPWLNLFYRYLLAVWHCYFQIENLVCTYDYRIKSNKLLHMSPRMSATSNKVNDPIVGAYAHGEPRFRHLGHQIPLVAFRIVTLDATADVFADPAAKGINEAVKRAHSKFTPFFVKKCEIKCQFCNANLFRITFAFLINILMLFYGLWNVFERKDGKNTLKISVINVDIPKLEKTPHR